MPQTSSQQKLGMPAGLAKIPPFPPVAARLLSLLSDVSVDIRRVAELISSDATFTASLLHRVNSAEFAVRYPIANVQHAVTTLGLDRTREVIVSHATAAYTRKAMRTDELRTCWQHMVATAVVSDLIASSAGAFTNMAFTAGMMHDIGRLGLLVAYPKEYERIIRDSTAHCVDLLDFETDAFGMNHAEAGRLLADHWGLPEELRIVAGRHHDPCEGEELDLLRIVHVACRLADVLGYGMAKELLPKRVDEVVADLPHRVQQRFEFTPAQLCSRIEHRVLEYDSERVDAPPKADDPGASPPVQESEALGEESATAELEIGRQTNGPTVLLLALVGIFIAVAALVWTIER